MSEMDDDELDRAGVGSCFSPLGHMRTRKYFEGRPKQLNSILHNINSIS